MLLYIIIFIVIIVMLLFVGILSYSKAYRTKNRIISIIENYGTYNEDAIGEINNDLSNIGYNMEGKDKCGDDLNTTEYRYCVYQYETNDGYYYKVQTFVHFNLPFVQDLIDFPVSSETKILGKNYDY